MYVTYCNQDEAENRIQKMLGIEFKKGLNSNLIPTCLVFIDLKKRIKFEFNSYVSALHLTFKKELNSNLIPVMDGF